MASTIGSASRIRHCIRRFNVLMQRVRQQKVRIAHVPDPQNPADYLTKFIDRTKVEWSTAYATNAKNAVPAHR